MTDDEEQQPAPFALGRSETTTSATTVGITNFARHMPSARGSKNYSSSSTSASSVPATAPAVQSHSSNSSSATVTAAAVQQKQQPRINLMDESLDAVLDDSDNDDDDNDQYYEDGIEIPPPPPPPKLPTFTERISQQVSQQLVQLPRTFTIAKSSTDNDNNDNKNRNNCFRIVTLTKCGAETTTETNIMNDDNNDNKKKRLGIGIGVVLLLLTVIALGLGLGLRSESDNNSEESSSSSSSSSEASDNNIAGTAEKVVDQEVNEPPSSTTATTYDVVIIGAGWAGIRALEILLSQNITNVLLLESTTVVGGRCRSYNADGSVNNPNIINTDDTAIKSAKATYNIGADWLFANTDMSNVLLDSGYLDGISNTYPATDTSIPMGVITGRYYRQTATSGSSTVDDDTTNDVGITTTVTAEAMSQQSRSNLMNDIWDDFHTLRSNQINEMFGMSYDDAINYYIDNNVWLYDYTVNTDDITTPTSTTTTRMAIDFLNFMKKSSEIQNSGDSSKLDITDINYLPPGYSSESLYMGGIGFGNLVAQYAQKYLSYVKLNSRVITINSDSTPDVTVVSFVTETNDDDDGINGGSSTTATTTTVQAKTVLVTVSLGVLKSDRIQFVPSLPENKRTIINAMGYGTVNKCILSWESNDAIVWPIDDTWFMLLTESSNTNDNDNTDDVQRRQRWTTFFNPSLLTGQPTLVAYIGGDDAIATESQTRNEVVEDVMTNLRSMFPTITNPDNVIVTRWGSEEDFYGAYAYPIAGRFMAEDAAILAEPIGRLYFAGEATSATRWGTTMGAWNTGEEQAYAITTRLLGWERN